MPKKNASRLNVFAETAGVVVADRPGITESFEDRVRLENLLLDGPELRRSRLAAEDGQILHDDLTSLCLSRTRLAADQDRLLPLIKNSTYPFVLYRMVHGTEKREGRGGKERGGGGGRMGGGRKKEKGGGWGGGGGRVVKFNVER